MTKSLFTGLSAFPLTPVTDTGLDEAAYSALVGLAAAAGVDSIGALGSTGSYAYMNRAERALAATLAVEAANGVPVIVGVGALRTRDVLDHVEDAQNAGAAGVLLAPMTYQALSDEEVFGLYEEVAALVSVPLVVYDNPDTTHVHFSDELHSRIAQLSAVASIKIPAVSSNMNKARSRVTRLRANIPDHVTIGISGDSAGAAGLLAGCEAWYSVIAGILPRECLAITRAAISGDDAGARALSDRFAPLWALFSKYGSYRVAAAVAVEFGLVSADSLPRPVRGLDGQGRATVATALRATGVRL